MVFELFVCGEIAGLEGLRGFADFHAVRLSLTDRNLSLFEAKPRKVRTEAQPQAKIMTNGKAKPYRTCA